MGVAKKKRTEKVLVGTRLWILVGMVVLTLVWMLEELTGSLVKEAKREVSREASRGLERSVTLVPWQRPLPGRGPFQSR